MADNNQSTENQEDGIEAPPQDEEQQQEQEDILDQFPNSGLNTEQYYSLITDERITQHEPLYQTGRDENLGSFLICIEDNDWVGFHYIEPAREWMRTYSGSDYEFVRKAHELYAAQDHRMWDERDLTGDEETSQNVDAARQQRPTTDPEDSE